MASASGRTTVTVNDPGTVKTAGPSAPRSAPPSASAYPPNSVAARLFAEPYAFDFFQAVRLLQMLQPDRKPVGLGSTVDVEAARFRTLASLTFPPSAIYELERPAPAQAALMTVTFFGLTGPSGILPRHYTELLMRIQRESKAPERFAMRDWLDMFSNRMTAHFYRAWAKYRFWLAYERGEPWRPDPDPFTASLLSLVGIGTPALRERLKVTYRAPAADRRTERTLTQVNDLVVAYFGGLLSHRPRHAVGLAAILSEYTGLRAEVRQFQGQWLEIEPDKQSRLGLGEGNSEVGTNFVIGERVWDVQSKIRIRLGPLSYAQFLEYLPDRTPFPERKAIFELIHLVRFYVGLEFDFDVQLLLAAEQVPEMQMPDGTEDGPQLGWNTWLVSQTLPQDADEAVFAGEEVVRVQA
jgi:type VI secretion system protein ImpH